MTESNAVIYARKEDEILDLKEKYAAEKRVIRTVGGAAIVLTLTCFGSAGYGIFIDGARALPPILFTISLFLGILGWMGRAFLKEEIEPIQRKQIRDAEREFKYWAIENPPC